MEDRRYPAGVSYSIRLFEVFSVRYGRRICDTEEDNLRYRVYHLERTRSERQR